MCPRVEAGQADVSLYSTGAKAPQPVSQYIIDVNGLRDPLSNRGFRQKYSDGRAGEVQTFVEEDPRVAAIREQVALLCHLNFRSGGAPKSWISFTFKDHHGTWIAPAVTELIAETLSALNYKVSTHHFAIKEAPTSLVM